MTDRWLLVSKGRPTFGYIMVTLNLKSLLILRALLSNILDLFSPSAGSVTVLSSGIIESASHRRRRIRAHFGFHVFLYLVVRAFGLRPFPTQIPRPQIWIIGFKQPSILPKPEGNPSPKGGGVPTRASGPLEWRCSGALLNIFFFEWGTQT